MKIKDWEDLEVELKDTYNALLFDPKTMPFEMMERVIRLSQVSLGNALDFVRKELKNGRT